MIKMTLDQAMTELKKPESRKMIRSGMRRTPDVSDPDAPDLIKLLKIGGARRIGRPVKENPKKALNLRLDADIVAAFQNTGPGWQTRINDGLRQMLKMIGCL